MKKYHFLGLGGIGMSGLARILKKKGYRVSGTDKKTSPLLESLQKEGILVGKNHLYDEEDSVHVVYSTAIEQNHPDLIYAKKRSFPISHRSEVLAELTHDTNVIAVVGTHGKTTVSALLSWVLQKGSLDPSFVIGGMFHQDFTNAHAGIGKEFIIEADESDGSFLKYLVDDAIITNIDTDHLNYWNTKENLMNGFQKFIDKTLGEIFWCCDDPFLSEMHPTGISYGFSKKADIQIQNFRQEGCITYFDLSFQNKLYENFSISLLGEHNALNASVVIGYALSKQIDIEMIREALKTFPGLYRRMQRKNPEGHFYFFDDYAHHPTAVFKTLKSVKQAFEERRLISVFQPHRYSRTRDCFVDFCHSFSYADEVWITDIDSAGEDPIAGITAKSLYEKIRHDHVRYVSRDNLAKELGEYVRPHDVVIGLGAGDITHLYDEFIPNYELKKWKIALIYGGKSEEHEISCSSKNFVQDALDPSIYEVKEFYITKNGKWKGKDFSYETLSQLQECDIAFPVLHGPNGEDGMVQGFFDTIELPYVGCDYQSSGLVMHKAWTKAVAKIRKILTSKYKVYFRNEPEIDLSEFNLNFPCWVKPARLGSSLGIMRVETLQELPKALEYCFTFDETVLVEEEIWGRQIEIGVMGNDFLHFSTPGEIQNHHQFYDYEKKYQQDLVKIPAEISKKVHTQIKNLAKIMYRACGCTGFCRIDFFLDSANKLWFNEINPIPGMTPTSCFPKMFFYDGLSHKNLVDRLIYCALHRSRKKIGKQVLFPSYAT